MSKQIPRGLRNNNPLNIRINPANAWLGKIVDNTDGSFEQFSTLEYGIRAALVLIRNYIRNKVNTPKRIINRWAPPSDSNDTLSYINTVCHFNLTPDSVIELDDHEAICNICYEMSKVELGGHYVDYSEFKRVYKKYFYHF